MVLKLFNSFAKIQIFLCLAFTFALKNSKTQGIINEFNFLWHTFNEYSVFRVLQKYLNYYHFRHKQLYLRALRFDYYVIPVLAINHYFSSGPKMDSCYQIVLKLTIKLRIQKMSQNSWLKMLTEMIPQIIPVLHAILLAKILCIQNF
jgi:hypothetical protein